VAKILVADDNSNIQKMVGLALKDQGIDVVAVGNGEAAVRKISDVHPDLVLADVFMPVRNGYEVCQYVKGDSALAHIPVILLVGAFDPLDEQEAQRVGADGVLKKPFVPPDPLISMVKSALARAGVSIGGAASVPPPKEEPLHVADMLAPRTPPPSSISLPALEDFPSVETEPVNEGIPARPEPVRIDEGSQPLAFGNLLESPATEQEDDLAFATTTPRPELERDWKSEHDEEEEVEEEEEEKQASSWRRDAGDASGSEEEESSGPVKDWRETAFSEGPAHKSRSGGWVPQKEAPSFQEAAEVEHGIAAVVTEAPIGEAKLAPESAAPLAAATLTPAPEVPFSQDAWAAALGEKPAAGAATEDAATAQKEEAPVSHYVGEPLSAPESSAPAASKEAEKPAAADSWYSAVSSPWDAEVQKASQLASTWDLPAGSAKPEPVPAVEPDPVVAAKEDPFATVDVLPSSLSEDVKAKVEEAALPAATVEAIREETQQVTDTVIAQAPLAIPAKEPAKTPQPSMEDLVAKVLAQMSPEVLQAVTREILKPVVEAMVRDELNAKKP